MEESLINMMKACTFSRHTGDEHRTITSDILSESSEMVFNGIMQVQNVKARPLIYRNGAKVHFECMICFKELVGWNPVAVQFCLFLMDYGKKCKMRHATGLLCDKCGILKDSFQEISCATFTDDLSKILEREKPPVALGKVPQWVKKTSRNIQCRMCNQNISMRILNQSMKKQKNQKNDKKIHAPCLGFNWTTLGGLVLVVPEAWCSDDCLIAFEQMEKILKTRANSDELEIFQDIMQFYSIVLRATVKKDGKYELGKVTPIPLEEIK